jgi:hypothetical protein
VWLACARELDACNVENTWPERTVVDIIAVLRAGPSHVGNTACHPCLVDIKTPTVNLVYCITAVGFHERNALTVPVNGCLQTAHVESEGAHLTHATRWPQGKNKTPLSSVKQIRQTRASSSTFSFEQFAFSVGAPRLDSLLQQNYPAFRLQCNQLHIMKCFISVQGPNTTSHN